MKKEYALKEHTKRGLSINQLPDGTWYTRWTKSGNLVKRRDKDKLIQAIIDHYADGIPCFRDLYRLWKEEDSQGIAAETLKRYDSDLQRFFPEDCEFCKTPITDMTYDVLTKFVKNAIVNHRLTTKSYSNMRIIMQHVFKKAWNLGYKEIDIGTFFRNIDLPRGIFTKPGEQTDDVYTNEERAAIYHYCMDHPTTRNLAVALICIASFRIGEVATFKPEDNIRRRYMMVQRKEGVELDDDGVYHNTVRDGAKQGHNGEVFVGDSGQQIINMAKLQMGGQEYLFSENGQRLTSRMIRYGLQKICKEINIRYRHPHQIRKTALSSLLDQNVPESIVQRQARHNDITTTQKYYHKNIYSEQEYEETLERAMSL